MLIPFYLLGKVSKAEANTTLIGWGKIDLQTNLGITPCTQGL